MQKRSIKERNKLVLQWKKIVFKSAWRYRGVRDAEIDDLMQVGYVGLIKAAESWDDSLGSFYTYAKIKIRGEISHYIRDRCSAVRIPRSEIYKVNRIVYSLNEPDLSTSDFREVVERIDNIPNQEEEEVTVLPDLKPALNSFTKRQRIIFEKLYEENKTQQEVCRELGLSTMTVFRDVKKIKENLRTLA